MLFHNKNKNYYTKQLKLLFTAKTQHAPRKKINTPLITGTCDLLNSRVPAAHLKKASNSITDTCKSWHRCALGTELIQSHAISTFKLKCFLAYQLQIPKTWEAPFLHGVGGGSVGLGVSGGGGSGQTESGTVITNRFTEPLKIKIKIWHSETRSKHIKL